MKNKLILVVCLLVLAAIFHPAPLPVTGNRGDYGGYTDHPTHLLFPLAQAHHQPAHSPGPITRVTVKDHFSYPVVEQPPDNAGYVSSAEDTLTQFRLAANYGSTGLLAHNYLAGAKFFALRVGDQIELIDLSGKSTLYLVYQVRKFQATFPTSAYSDFIDLEDGEIYSSTELFLDLYGKKGLLIFQTCIEEEGIDSWGRLFVIAVPVTAHIPISHPDRSHQYVQNPH